MQHIARKLDGTEAIGDRSVVDFWRWAYSDLLNNTTRGVLAEYIAAAALGVDGGVRDAWSAHDLTSPEGIKVEVKSSAYVQSWTQRKPSRITFSIRPAKPWNAETGTYAKDPARSADVYIFALLADDDRASINPLNLSKWIFYVVPTRSLNALPATKRTVALRELQGLGAVKASPGTLRAKVIAAAGERSST